MKPTKLSANEQRLAELLRDWGSDGYSVPDPDTDAWVPDRLYGDQRIKEIAAFLARRGVLAVSAATVPYGTWDDLDFFREASASAHRDGDTRNLLRRLARG